MKMKLIIFFLIVVGGVCCNKRDQGSEKIYTRERVFDQVGLLSDFEKDKIDSVSLELEEKIGSQIAIVIIDKLHGEKIEDFSLQTFNEMNLGRSQFDDGVLIVHSVKDRKIRIEVGLGDEKILRDEIVSRINREIIIPKIKEAKYFDGYYEGVIKISTLILENRDLSPSLVLCDRHERCSPTTCSMVRV